MLREIGSEYDWNSNDNISINKSNNYFGRDYVLFRSGRDALRYIASKNKGKTLLCSPLFCESMIEPFLENKINLFLYKTLDGQKPNIPMIIKNLNNVDMILFHNYFGIVSFTDDDIMRLLKIKPELIIIYDATHDFFRDSNKVYDYKIISIRKWFSIPEGGLLFSKKRSDVSSAKIDKVYFKMRVKGMKSKSEYLQNEHFNKEEFLYYFNHSNGLLDYCNGETYIGTERSKIILENIDIQKMLGLRLQNFIFLNKLMKENIVTKNLLLSESVSSTLYYPIMVDNRDAIQKKLALKGIYCPVIWPPSRYYNNNDLNVSNIYKYNLCIPCDHRYNKDDMDYVFQTLLNLMGGQ